jgi:hypothetical protein
MSSISDKPKGTNRDYKAQDVLPTDGPHRFVKKKVTSEKEKEGAPSGIKAVPADPPYVIAVTKHPEPEDGMAPPKTMYNPEELRAKAKTFLNNPNITSEQKDVLKEILGPEKEEPPRT